MARINLGQTQRAVLRKTTRDSAEVGIVLGPSSMEHYVAEVAHGWIDNPPTVGLFDLSDDAARRGLWQIASKADAARVRKLFLEHARSWGPESRAWVAGESDPGPDAWASAPVALSLGAT